MNNAGQALIEALVGSLFLLLISSLIGFALLTPLCIFYAEDQIEEALQCATFQNARSCEKKLIHKLETGVLNRWVGTVHLSCHSRSCTATTLWKWMRPLPLEIRRTLLVNSINRSGNP